MSDIALRVDGLGKRYRIGMEQAGGLHRYKSLRDSLGSLARRPMQALRELVVREPMNESNSFWALSDINFEVKRGAVVGIIGRNGAGKSTLLKILSRITKPTVGHVALAGRIGSLLEVGTGFHPELTGKENVYLNGAILGMTRAEVKAKFREIVAFSEIDKFLDTAVKHYSSGMYMRLAFAVAAHLDPEILVVDEVLAVGDAAFQKKCLGKIRDVADGGRTVLFVTHNMGVVGELCASTIWLDHGCLKRHGPSGEVVAAYLGSLSENSVRAATPTNGRTSVLRVEVLDATGNVTTAIGAAEKWSVRVRYELTEPLHVGVSLRVTSAQGPVVIDTHEFIGGADMRPAGIFETTTSFDTEFLAPGDYFVSVYIMTHHGLIELLVHDYLGFSVIGALRGYGGSLRQWDIGGVFFARPRHFTERVSASGVAHPAAEPNEDLQSAKSYLV